MSWAIWALPVAGITVAVLLLHIKKSRRQRDLLINRLRTSAMYSEIHQLLADLPAELIETLILRQQDITVKLLNGQSITYDFQSHHIDPLNPDTLLVMAQAVLIDLPVLQDTRYYTCLMPGRRDTRPRYIYTMRHNRKDYLLRSMRGQL